MSRSLIPGILTVSLVGACQVLPLTASKGESELGGSTRTTAKTATTRSLPTASPTDGKASGGSNAAAPTPTPKPSDAANADQPASTAAAVTTPVKLTLTGAAPSGLRLLPIRDKYNELTGMRFGSNISSATWHIAASNGKEPIPIVSLKVELTQLAVYAAIEPAEEDVPATSEEGDLVATPEVAATTISSTLAPADLKWPSAFAPGKPVDLTYDLNSAAIRTFVGARPNLSQLKLTISLLGEGSKPLVFDTGAPMELTTTISVL